MSLASGWPSTLHTASKYRMWMLHGGLPACASKSVPESCSPDAAKVDSGIHTVNHTWLFCSRSCCGLLTWWLHMTEPPYCWHGARVYGWVCGCVSCGVVGDWSMLLEYADAAACGQAWYACGCHDVTPAWSCLPTSNLHRVPGGRHDTCCICLGYRPARALLHGCSPLAAEVLVVCVAPAPALTATEDLGWAS